MIEYHFDLELVTVQPLTRGTGHHFGPTVSSSGNRGGGNITIPINVILDGRIIATRIKKIALGDYPYQV